MDPTDLAALVDEELALRRAAGRDPGPLMIGVTVRACDRGKCRSARAKGKVDTGAGRTYIPKGIAKRLRPKKLGKTKAMGVVGNGVVQTYSGVELDVAGREVKLPRVLEYATADRMHVLLGRDAMVDMDLSYDGTTGKFALVPKRGGRGKRRKR